MSVRSHHLEEDFIATPLAIAKGCAGMPGGAGLGVEVRERDLTGYRI